MSWQTPPFTSNEDSVGTPMAAAAPPQLGPTPWISFSGAPNESAALFVQSVQRIAFTQNRMKDDEWIAEYASTCFAEAAMVWFVNLDDEVQTSWKKLRLALVQRYPVQVPTPQPAPSVVPATPKAASPGITEIGRVEVLRPEFGDFFGYLSQDSTGRFVVNPGEEKALRLKAVLHTDSQNQDKKIYSLRMLDAPDSRYPFLGLRLFKFPGEDPDVVPASSLRNCQDWEYLKDVPSCCKVSTYVSSKVQSREGRKTTEYATWEFTEATESLPTPYYIRKAKGPDPKSRVVSAVWNLRNPSANMAELRLTWPCAHHTGANVVYEAAIEAVLHHGGTEGLHAHASELTSRRTVYLEERHVILVFKSIPNS